MECRYCGADDDQHDYEQMARYCYPSQLNELRARMHELIAIMESDIGWGNIIPGETRLRLLEDARKLAPGPLNRRALRK